MRKFLFVLLLCGAALASQEATFSESAVWSPKPGDEEETWADMRQCGAMHAGGSPGTFEVCVGDAMRKHGAPEAAIAFNRATSGNAYATRFQPSMMHGRVGVMYAMNPFLANSNDQVFFVNGTPGVVSADEHAMKMDSKKDAAFQAVQKAFPNAFLFPHVEGKPVEEGGSKNSGQSFTFAAPILDGCHACARLAVAHLRYEFDGNGRFTGVKINGIVREEKHGSGKKP
jgi:hypothetical protein